MEYVVVPTAQIPEFVYEVEKISKKHNVRVFIHGHPGDGNIHSNIGMNPDGTDEDWKRKLPKVQKDLYIAAKNLGGTISGEHGIGCKRKKFMPIVASDAEIDFMRRIKRGVDPNNILNPGKIFEL